MYVNKINNDNKYFTQVNEILTFVSLVLAILFTVYKFAKFDK